MHYEVEQKFPLSDVESLTARLTAVGCRPVGECEQADHYFNHPAHDFAQTDEALRIRQVDGRALVTYKGPKIDRLTKTRRELELPLGEGPETAEQFSELLVALGFVPVATVRKHRRTLELQWQGHAVEVALDEVSGLGHFVELELSADETTLEAGRAALADLASRLELGASERRSYLELLLERH